MDILAPFVIHRKRNGLKLVAIITSVLCLVGALSQTARAENTYVITDGNDVTVFTTHSSDPVQVLQEAGVNLDKDDSYTTAPGDGVSEITVQRAQTITVRHADEVLQANSYGETLESLFDRLGIPVDDSTLSSIPLDTVTYDGMEVQVNRLQKYTERYTIEQPFETVYVEDPTLAAGEEKILVPGKAGQLLCTANVEYINQQEQSRNVYQRTLIEEPVNQVIAIGTDTHEPSSIPVIGDGTIVLPSGEVLTYTHADQYLATAYTQSDDGCGHITANGSKVKVGVVAVDPSVIPYGTRMFIISDDGQYIYGIATAEDCGGAIQDKRIDLYMESRAECIQFGVRKCNVYFLGDANWRDNGF